MKRYGWIWRVCTLLLAGCLPLSSTQKPQALVINEYLLSAPPDISRERLVFHFTEGDQKEILARTEDYRDSRTQINEYNRLALAPFGYTLEGYHRSDGGFPHSYSFIYHGDEMIARGVMYMPPISVNASGTDFIGVVELSEDGRTYILTRNSFEKRPWPPEREPYVYVGDQFLFIESTTTAHQQGVISIYLDDRLVYQVEIHPVSTYATFDGPWSYDKHWALVLLDAKLDNQGNWEMVNRVVMDGQDLNTAKGYEQSFQFTVLDNRPFYFYQKSGKIDISFDGQDIAKDYDEIPHYSCCSPGLLNPGISMNMIWFFARRGKDWYYIEAYVPIE